MTDSSTFDGVFYITLVGAVIGFLGLLARQCFQIKCSETTCCYGLIVIKRDTKVEEQIEEYKLDHGIYDSRRDSIPIPNSPTTRTNTVPPNINRI